MAEAVCSSFLVYFSSVSRKLNRRTWALRVSDHKYQTTADKRPPRVVSVQVLALMACQSALDLWWGYVLAQIVLLFSSFSFRRWPSRQITTLWLAEPAQLHCRVTCCRGDNGRRVGCVGELLSGAWSVGHESSLMAVATFKPLRAYPSGTFVCS